MSELIRIKLIDQSLTPQQMLFELYRVNPALIAQGLQPKDIHVNETDREDIFTVDSPESMRSVLLVHLAAIECISRLV